MKNPLRGKRISLPGKYGIFISGGAVLFLVVGLIAWWIIQYRSTNDFRVLLVQADIALEDHNYARAQDLLLRLVPLVNNPHDGLRILRRAFELADATGSTDGITRISSALLDRYPGNQDIRGLRTAVLLEQNRVTEAAEVSRGLTADRWLPYKIEAYLKARIPLEERLINLRLPGIALPIPVSSYSDPNAFLQSWIITRDFRYLKNAVLLLAALGDLEESLHLMQAQHHRFTGPEDNLLFTLLTYDVLGPNQALVQLSRLSDSFPENPNLYRLLSDLYFFQGNIQAASSSLEQVLPTALVEPVDFINRSRYLRLTGRYEEAFAIIEEGLGRFPGNGMLIQAQVALLLQSGFSPRATLLINQALNTNPRDPDLLLTELLIQSRDTGYQAVLSRLWQLSLDFPDHEQIGRVLLWILWSLDDRDGFEQALGMRNPRLEPWVYQFMALEALRRNDTPAALELVGKLPEHGMLAGYLGPGLQVALSYPAEVQGQQVFERAAALVSTHPELPPRVREYFLTLLTWNDIILGRLESADHWFRLLVEHNQRSIHISRLSYWLGQARIEYDNN